MYDYLVPSVNFMGAGCVSKVGERCKILGGKKALIVTDSFLKNMEGGAVEVTVESLKEAGLDVAYFDGVVPNPKDITVKMGLEVYKTENCDMIVTVGG
jgi:1,3-propanediol dehydrogenase